MKKANFKRDDRYEVKSVDVDEVELDFDVDEVEDEPEPDWVVAEEEVMDQAELEEDNDLFEAEADHGREEDEGEFDPVAPYFRESARHKLLAPDHERRLTEAVKAGRMA